MSQHSDAGPLAGRAQKLEPMTAGDSGYRGQPEAEAGPSGKGASLDFHPPYWSPGPLPGPVGPSGKC